MDRNALARAAASPYIMGRGGFVSSSVVVGRWSLVVVSEVVIHKVLGLCRLSRNEKNYWCGEVEVGCLSFFLSFYQYLLF